MSDEQIIALLTEIRDLQKRNSENYERGLANQRESIDFQKSFARRQRKVALLVIVIVVVTFAIMASLPRFLVHR